MELIRRKMLAMKTVAVTILLLVCSTGLTQQQLTKPHAAAIAKWQALVPVIDTVLAKHNLKCHGEWETSIVDAIDISSDDTSIALVDWCNGGAYTDWIIAMNLEGDRPVLSRFRNANHQIEHVEFASGSSVMHSIGVELVKAYVWNKKTRTFRLDIALSKHATQSRCQESSERSLR